MFCLPKTAWPPTWFAKGVCMNKRLLLIPLVLAIVLGVLVAGAALAQTATPPASQSAPNSASPAAPAQGLGRGLGFFFGLGNVNGKQDWTVFDTIAKTLKLTPAQLFDQLHSGKTLSEIATAQGVDINSVQSAVQSARTQAIKDQINQAVKDGRITQDQANWLLQGLDKGYLNRGFGGLKGGPMGRFGGRGMRGGFGGGSQSTPKASPTPGI